MIREHVAIRSAALAAALLLSTGCAAAGLAGGPLVSAIQMVGDRTVERAVRADRGTALAATLDALSRLGVPASAPVKDGEDWRVEGGSDTFTVVVTVSAVTPRLTRLSVRAEGGSIVADKPSGQAILDEVVASLDTLTAPVAVQQPAAPTSEALSAIQEELRRLRSHIEQRPLAPAASGVANGREPAAAGANGVYVVPAGAGLPRHAEDHAPAPPPLASPPVVSGPIAPQMSSPSLHEQRAAPLRPAETLSPIQVLPDTSPR
ncbi:MAG TPA: hypothetical protein VNN07_04550 [Candidatus Tectomicrobia bacterium]|nr:hypothetical protein [Candidatus Tectomicrobia bacterium]